MKNKKFLAVAAGVCLFATVGYANNYLISGLGFVAPSIIGKSNIYNPQVGEIVYDSVDGTFYGYDQNNQWQTLNAGASVGVPSGVIQAFGGAAAPAGYLICDGRPVSRMTYANLYAAIGDAFGAGDGVNTFNLPDLRGRFLRGVDAGAGHDPDASSRIESGAGGNLGDAVGSLQADLFKSHNHNTSLRYENRPQGSGGGQLLMRTNGGSGADNYLSTDAGGAETRPKNVSVNYIIKI